MTASSPTAIEATARSGPTIVAPSDNRQWASRHEVVVGAAMTFHRCAKVRQNMCACTFTPASRPRRVSIRGYWRFAALVRSESGLAAVCRVPISGAKPREPVRGPR